MADVAALHAELKGILRGMATEVDRVGGVPAKAVLARMAQDFMAFVDKVPPEAGAAAGGAPAQTAATAEPAPHTHESIVAAAADMPMHLVGRLIGDLKRLVRAKAATTEYTDALTEAGAAELKATGVMPTTTAVKADTGTTETAPPPAEQHPVLDQQQSGAGTMAGQQQTGVNALNEGAAQTNQGTG